MSLVQLKRNIEKIIKRTVHPWVTYLDEAPTIYIGQVFIKNIKIPSSLLLIFIEPSFQISSSRKREEFTVRFGSRSINDGGCFPIFTAGQMHRR